MSIFGDPRRSKGAWRHLATKRTGLIPGAALVAALGLVFAGPALGVAGDGSVSATAATFTPTLATNGTDGSVEQIRQLVPCGSDMYAVGRFTSIKQGATTYTRNNAFS
nr:hypothetical protein [Propionibacteriales bacterium]